MSKYIWTDTKLIAVIFAILGLVTMTGFAQSADNGNERITDSQQLVIINTAIAQLKENYIFPERISKIESLVKKKFDGKEYSKLITLFDFLEVLNKDFESYGNDHHLNIFYSPAYVNKIRATEKNKSDKPCPVPAEFVDMVKYENFFLKRVERTDGNIGYFKFNKFEELQFSKEAIVSSMNFISNSSAIILDLSQNGGGSAETVHFIMSYFLPDSTRLGTYKRRKNNEVVELWTINDPVIKKIPTTVPLYIIVSKDTSSAAESLAYGLQQFKRAVIVGEQTHGEGNPGVRFVINDKLYMMIPTATNVNIKTGTSWEGTGVTPDIKTDVSNAYARSIVEICQILAKPTKNDIYRWISPEFEAQLNPEMPTAEFLDSVIGNYDDGKKITQENGAIYFVSGTGKRKMIYMGHRTFSVEGRKDYRIRFPVTGKVIENAEVIWNDGSADKLKKIN